MEFGGCDTDCAEWMEHFDTQSNQRNRCCEWIVDVLLDNYGTRICGKWNVFGSCEWESGFRWMRHMYR